MSAASPCGFARTECPTRFHRGGAAKDTHGNSDETQAPYTVLAISQFRRASARVTATVVMRIKGARQSAVAILFQHRCHMFNPLFKVRTH
jgi:hypothetical protein